jgi:hypothetical protein
MSGPHKLWIGWLTFSLAASACGTDVTPNTIPPTQFNVTTAGGTISLAGGLVTIDVPAGAVAQDTMLTAQSAVNPPASGLLVGGSAVDLGPNGFTFLRSVQVTIRYSTLSLPAGVGGSELRLNSVVNGAWTPVRGSSADEPSETVTASIRHFSTYGLVAVSVASVSVAPAPLSLALGDTVTLQATPRDAGGATLPGRAVSWASSDPAVATVGASSGLVRAVSTGAAAITATSEGVTGTDSVTVASAATSRLAFTTPPPVSVAAGASFGSAVSVLDSASHTDTTFGGAVEISILTGSGTAGAHLLGTTTVNAVKGVATFSGLSIDSAGTGFRLAANASGVTTGRSPVFAVAAGAVSLSRSTVSVSSSTVRIGNSVALLLQARDALGNLLGRGGATVVFSASGGTSTGSIGATTDHGDGSYTASFTGVSVGTATTIGATIDGAAVTSTLPTVTVDTTSSSAWLEEDFSEYTSTANLKSNPRGIYNGFSGDGNESYNTSQIFLDQSVGYTAGGLTQSMRYDFPANNVNSDYTIGVNLSLPSSASEIWVELVARFSSNFTTLGPASGNADYKFFMGRVSGGSGNRFMLYCGTYGNGWQFGYPGNDQGDGSDVPGYYGNEAYPFSASGPVWDGQWHVYRFHYKVASSGVARWTKDGVEMPGFANKNTTAGGTVTGIYGLALGRNMNRGNSQAMSLWWGRIRVYRTDPGWGI